MIWSRIRSGETRRSQLNGIWLSKSCWWTTRWTKEIGRKWKEELEAKRSNSRTISTIIERIRNSVISLPARNGLRRSSRLRKCSMIWTLKTTMQRWRGSFIIRRLGWETWGFKMPTKIGLPVDRSLLPRHWSWATWTKKWIQYEQKLRKEGRTLQSIRNSTQTTKIHLKEQSSTKKMTSEEDTIGSTSTRSTRWKEWDQEITQINQTKKLASQKPLPKTSTQKTTPQSPFNSTQTRSTQPTWRKSAKRCPRLLKPTRDNSTWSISLTIQANRPITMRWTMPIDHQLSAKSWTPSKAQSPCSMKDRLKSNSWRKGMCRGQCLEGLVQHMSRKTCRGSRFRIWGIWTIQWMWIDLSSPKGKELRRMEGRKVRARKRGSLLILITSLI